MKNNFDHSKLHGRIIEKFGSCSKLAEYLGIAQSTLSQKLSNKYDFSMKEIVTIKELLDISDEELCSYFFKIKVENIQH